MGTLPGTSREPSPKGHFSPVCLNDVLSCHTDDTGVGVAIQLTGHMKLKKKEDQSVDASILIGKWIKTLMCHSQPIE